MINISITQNEKVVGALCNVSEIRRDFVYVETSEGEFEFDCIIATNEGVDHYFLAGPQEAEIADAVMKNIWLAVTIDRAQMNHFRGLDELMEWANPHVCESCAAID
jgi:hypothetical protein